MIILVGTYSQPDEGRPGNGEGIYSVEFDAETGSFGRPQLQLKCLNPSWLELSPDRKTVFAVREVFAIDHPAVSSFEIQEGGHLRMLSQFPTQGELPCHLAFDPYHNRLASAQYWTGDVEIFSAELAGLRSSNQFHWPGSGPNVTRQAGPHAHFVMFSDKGKVLHVIDLGSDRVISIRLEADNSVSETSILSLPAGSGPRHMALNRDASRAWLLCELNEALVSLRRDSLGWKIDNIQSGFTAGEHTDGAAAAIRLTADQKHFYISERLQSRIAGFQFDGTKICEVDSGGLAPRDVILTTDGRWVIVANQLTDNLTSFSRNPISGELLPTGNACDIGSPVSLLEISNPQ